jgi:nucleoside-diphosphate-sugar epimerase
VTGGGNPRLGQQISALAKRYLTFDILIRVAADVLQLWIGLFVALSLKFFYFVMTDNAPQGYRQALRSYIDVYLGGSIVLLSLVGIAVFALSGFYTRGRAYTSKYKVIIIAQSVSVTYLIFSGGLYLSQSAFVSETYVAFPRSAFVLAWLLTMGLMITTRVWSSLWRKTVRAELGLAAATQLPEQRDRRVLVIGGAGYIGSALLPKLLDNGYKVRLLDMLLYGTEPIKAFAGHPNLELVQADFRQVDKIVEATRDVDTVVHLGAIVGDPACALDETLTVEVNVMATRMVAEVAKGMGVRHFVFASTCSVYGKSDVELDERSALHPVSLYARSKIASERVLAGMANDHFITTVLRFSTIYGLSGRTRFDLVVNLLTAKAISDGKITVIDGDQWRPFLHVDDAALSIAKVLEAAPAVVANEVFNVGSDSQNYTIEQVGEMVNEAVPTAALIKSKSGADPRNYRVSFKKISRCLGFEPRWTLEKGIEQVISAFKAGSIADYRAPEYSNEKFLSEQGVARIRKDAGWAFELVRDAAASDQPESGQQEQRPSRDVPLVATGGAG